jgi:lysophospholipase L1-like esterase
MGRLRAVCGRTALGAGATVLALATIEVALRILGLGHPILYDNRATYGYRPLPDQSVRRLFGARVHVNRLGLRGPDAPDGALRVLFLGDSVTWGGSYVDDRELFATVAADVVAERLGDRVPPVVAEDAGVNGWGPENVLALVDAEGGFGSRLWVLTLVEDDFRREKTRIGEVPYFNVAPSTALEELLVLAGYRVVSAYKARKPDTDLARLATANVAACSRIFAAAERAGAHLLVVWHPTEPALAEREPEPAKPLLLAAAAAANVPVLDLAPAYRAAGGGLYSDGLHLSVAGHRVAGRAIGERLATLLSAY